MTIINPKKNKSGLSLTFVGLILLLVILAGWNIFVYNQTVELNHNLAAAESRFRELKITNAEAVNQLYLLVDSGSLLKLGEERGLIKVNSPGYVEINSLWSTVSVSR